MSSGCEIFTGDTPFDGTFQIVRNKFALVTPPPEYVFLCGCFQIFLPANLFGLLGGCSTLAVRSRISKVVAKEDLGG